MLVPCYNMIIVAMANKFCTHRSIFVVLVLSYFSATRLLTLPREATTHIFELI